jgi:hypothetical protein
VLSSVTSDLGLPVWCLVVVVVVVVVVGSGLWGLGPHRREKEKGGRMYGLHLLEIGHAPWFLLFAMGKTGGAAN